MDRLRLRLNPPCELARKVLGQMRHDWAKAIAAG